MVLEVFMKFRYISILAVILVAFFAGCDSGGTTLGGGDEPLYTVTVDGTPVSVTSMDAFSYPVHYARFDYSGASMSVSVMVNGSTAGYALSPKSRNILVSGTGSTLSFSVSEPAYLVLQIPGQETLFILVDPPEVDPPAPEDADVTDVMTIGGMDNTGATDVTTLLQGAIDAASGAVRNIVYVPAGTYLTNSLLMRSNMTLYLAEGAVLKCGTPQNTLLNVNASGLTVIEVCSRGFIVFAGVTNAHLAGRGTLDGNGTSLRTYNRKMFLVKFEDSDNCTIDGIISRDSCFWNTMIYRSSDIAITNYKVINERLEEEWNETDGVDFNNCMDSSLYNAFLYTGDDCMAVKSDDILDSEPQTGINDPTTGSYMNTGNIAHERIVCFSGSSACKVGTKTFGETMSGITFTDIDVIQGNRGLVIDAVDTATISGIVFEDIRIENLAGRLVDFNMDPDAITWRTTGGDCRVDGVSVIDVASDVNAECRIGGFSVDNLVENVSFANFTIQGNAVNSVDDSDADFIINVYSNGITFP
jgi:polygalacturonase